MSETTVECKRCADLLTVVEDGAYKGMWSCASCSTPATDGEMLRSRTRALRQARAQLTAAQAERDGWEQRTKHLGSVVLRAWEVLRKWWQFSKLEERDEPFADALARAITADREHDAYALGEMQRLNAVIETVTRERDEAAAAAASIVERNVILGQDLATSRAALEVARHTLSGIANADWREFGDGFNTPEEFIAWAKSRAKWALGSMMEQTADDTKPFPNRSSAPETQTAPVEAGAVNSQENNNL